MVVGGYTLAHGLSTPKGAGRAAREDHASRIIAAALGAALAAGAAQAQDTRIALGATNARSSHCAYFTALANLVDEETDGIRTSVVETGATVDNLQRMERGQLDAGLVTTTALHHADEGQHGFEGEPIGSKLLFTCTLAPSS